MSAKFSASMMCLPMDNIGSSIIELERAGIDRLHLDLMDGVFVPNYSLGMQDIEAICRLSNKPCELHLMTVNPGRYIDKFAKLGIDIIYIHPDSDYPPSTVISAIIAAGVKPGIVLSPGTSVESVKDLLRISKYVLVMTVNPGEAGQNFLPYVSEKIHQLVKLKKEYDFEIALDGACSAGLISQYYPVGIDAFVLGTAALFNNKMSYSDSLKNLRALTDGVAVSQKQSVIKLFVTDVDGTLTDGKIYMGENGEVMKAFNIKDGYALHEMLPDNGITPIIVTGRKSKIVENRARELGITQIHQGIGDKATKIRDIAKSFNCKLSEIAYFGDDDNDLGAMELVGLTGCPADASENVKQSAKFISRYNGGNGAAREFAEMLIRRQNKWSE